MTRASHEYENPLPLRISELVRGPAALRDDIADEIADHLACHAEEQNHNESDTAEAEAIRAFGDPERIARELRAVHLGDLIMFQRIMVAALVLIAAGMAGSAYLSWSATRSMTTQMAQVTRETSHQFAEVAKQLASLSNVQLANQPPRMKIYCYTIAPEQPAAGYKLNVESVDMVGDKSEPQMGRTFSSKYESDAAGHIETGPLPLGVYRIGGTTVSCDSEPNAIPGDWTRVIRLQQSGTTREERICVGSNFRNEVRIVLPPELTWDLAAMKSVNVVFGRTVGPFVFGTASETWRTPACTIDLTRGSTLVGLLPGTASPFLRLPDSWRLSERGNFADVSLPNVQIDNSGKPICLQVKRLSDRRITGMIYDGTKDKPVIGACLEVIHRRPGPHRPATDDIRDANSPELLRTDAAGRFGSIASAWDSQVILHWKTPDGTPTSLVCWLLPQRSFPDRDAAPFYWEIDVSKLSTLRVTCTGIDKLREKGFEISTDQPSGIEWYLSDSATSFFSSSGATTGERKGDALRVTALMLPGAYTLVPAFNLRRENTRPSNNYGIDRERIRVKQDLSPGRVHDVRFALEDALYPSPAPLPRPRPLTTTRATSGAGQSPSK